MRLVRGILLDHRVKAAQFSDWQFGFRRRRGCADSQFVLQTVFDYSSNVLRKRLFFCIIDLKKAFDSVDHGVLVCVLLSMGLDPRIIDLI